MALKKLEKVTTPKTINWFGNNEKLMRFDLPVQRKRVWKAEQKSLLIHSLLYGYPVPTFYSCDVGDGLYSIIDGQQRLTTIIDYVNGRFALSEDTPDVFGEDIAGKYFSDLSEETQKELKGINLMIFHYKNINLVEIEELFYRLNNGTALTRIEKTRAQGGEFLKDVNEYLESELFEERLQMNEVSKNRFKDTELLLQTMMVFEGVDNFKNIGSAEIERFVREKRVTGLYETFVEDFDNAVDFVVKASSCFNKKELKMFKKTNVPVILRVADQMIHEGMSADVFGQKLVEFFVTNYTKDSDYAILVKSGTTNKENVKSRIKLLKESMKEELAFA